MPKRCGRIFKRSCETATFDEAARDAALKGPDRNRPVRQGFHRSRSGNRLVVHLSEARRTRPRGVRRQQEGQGRRSCGGHRLQAARRAAARHGARRRQRHHRGLPARRARRRQGRTCRSSTRGNGRVDLIYAITEGAKTTVRQINFTGNHVFGKRQLNAVIKTSATNMLSFLTGGDVYDPDRIAQDREQLRLYYRSKGYADAECDFRQGRIRSGDQGIRADFRDRRGPALSFRRRQHHLQHSGAGLRQTPPPAARPHGRGVRRQRTGQDHRNFRGRDGKARLSLCKGHAPPRPRCRRPARRHHSS